MSRLAEAYRNDPIIEVIDVPDPARYDELEPLETEVCAAEMLDRVRSGDAG